MLYKQWGIEWNCRGTHKKLYWSKSNKMSRLEGSKQLIDKILTRLFIGMHSSAFVGVHRKVKRSNIWKDYGGIVPKKQKYTLSLSPKLMHFYFIAELQIISQQHIHQAFLLSYQLGCMQHILCTDKLSEKYWTLQLMSIKNQLPKIISTYLKFYVSLFYSLFVALLTIFNVFWFYLHPIHPFWTVLNIHWVPHV